MRIHYLMHHPDEGLGAISQWAINKGHTLSVSQFYDPKHILPQMIDFEALIVLGGPQSVYDEAMYDWMIPENLFIKNCITANKKILGICLGSQLLAHVLGAKVYPNTKKEIGWFPIQFSQPALQSFFNHCTEKMSVFHWHGDTFDLPNNATTIASSEATKNQGFIWNNQVIGLQFHSEINKKTIDAMSISFAHELISDTYVQNVSKIAENVNLIPYNNQMMFQLLDNFFA